MIVVSWEAVVLLSQVTHLGLASPISLAVTSFLERQRSAISSESLKIYCTSFIEHLCPSSHFYLQKDEEQWELIGSRTYKWNGSEALRCKHWDKVAVRWHLSTCEWRNGRRSCNGGTNADLARDPQTHSELPRWRNAFTYAQLPNSNHKHQHLRLGLEGYDKKMFEVKLVTPLKIDVDWKWTIGEDGCNNFSVRMSAMSTIDERRLTELTEFCRSFDIDGFVSCINL